MNPLTPFPVHPLCPSCGGRDCARYTGGVCPAAPNTEVPAEWELEPKEAVNSPANVARRRAENKNKPPDPWVEALLRGDYAIEKP